ncbi:hypothetical protein MBLNU457_4265t1 [Dothideomycetes sp. NU457]
MPPKKGKAAAAKGKKAAKPAQAEPVEDAPAETNGAEAVAEEQTEATETAKPEENSKPEDGTDDKAATGVEQDGATAPAEEESKPEEPKVEDAQEEAPAENTEETPVEDAPDKENEKPKPATKSKKRKAEDTQAGESAKASRRSTRGTGKAQPSQQQLLNFLLSNEAADMCRPEDEAKDLEGKGDDYKTYSSTALSPFEELLCAIVLSRPISHRLGLRTIRTILNSPYGFNSPKAIQGFTPEQRHQAMFDARTQHKEKTASQIGMVADVIANEFGKNAEDTSLEKVRTTAKKDWDEERTLLQSHIKGLGKTGLDIFFRRVQWAWPEAFPFFDERTARGIDKLGLPKNPDALVKVLNENWSKLNTSILPKGDKESLKRRAFVIICERATAADLEGNSEALIEAAATA